MRFINCKAGVRALFLQGALLERKAFLEESGLTPALVAVARKRALTVVVGRKRALVLPAAATSTTTASAGETAATGAG